jgi:hypothetical protein
MKTDHKRIVLTALAAGIVSATAQAGGPLYLFDSGHPYAWDVSSPVQVFTDLGDLCDNDDNWPYNGCLSNEQADAAVAFGFAEWTGVESSSFQAEVAGDFADVGLGDITGANAGDVIDTWNGGGYHVIYDSDGSVLRDFFGIYGSVLGISSPEWAEGDTITESWAVINVASVPEGDDGSKAAGVMTHEFGHGINLAHSQANGAITFIGSPWYWIAWAPQNCGAPYDVGVIEDWMEYQDWIFNTMIPATETMYPFIQPNETGMEMSTVDRPDDIAAVSNIYPGSGWPTTHASISGNILLKDGDTGLTGVNVVARNVADPLGDVVTVMSGDLTQGMAGPDGRYTINGLTPGAEYVLYVEGIYQGGFPTPPAALPSFQEYWNTGESADAMKDDPCEWTPIAAEEGASQSADIAFNGFDGAPTLVQIPVASATDVDNSGRMIAGTFGDQVVWLYDSKTGLFDGIASRGSARLTRSGNTTIANLMPELPPWEGGKYQPALWNFNTGITELDMPADEEGCDGTIMSPYDLTASGDAVVGLAYRNGCSRGDWHPDGPNKFWAGKWTAANGLEYLETPDWVLPDMPECTWSSDAGGFVDGCMVRGSRANAVSGDGSVIAGHLDAQGWKGSAWVDGELFMIGEDDPKGWVGSVNAVSDNGAVAIGGDAGDYNDFGWALDGYIWDVATRTTTNIGHVSMPCETFAPWACDWVSEIELPTTPFGVSNKGDIVVGRAGSPWDGFAGFFWMEETGIVEFGEFLRGQGIVEAYTNDLISPLAISGDGKTIVGWGLGQRDLISFAVTLNQVWICRKGKSSLAGFPGAMLTHLDKGATLGLCEQDRVIVPGS